MILRVLETILSATGATILITLTLAFLFSAYIRSKGQTGIRSIGFSASLIAPYLAGLFLLLCAGFYLLLGRG